MVAVVPDSIRTLPVQYKVKTIICDDSDIYDVLYPLVTSGRTFKVLDIKESGLASEGWANKTKELFASKKDEKDREEYERLKNKFEK